MNVVYRCAWFENINGELIQDGVTYTLSKFTMQQEIQRRKQVEPKSYCQDMHLAIVGDNLANRIYKNGGIFNTLTVDDNGYYGKFIPRSPKANIDLYRSGDERTPEQAALSAEMTGTS